MLPKKRKKRSRHRIAFEQWIRLYVTHKIQREGSGYIDPEVNARWLGWEQHHKQTKDSHTALVKSLEAMVGSFYSVVLSVPEGQAKTDLVKHFKDAPIEAQTLLTKLKARISEDR